MRPKPTDLRRGVRLRVLSDEQVEDLHLASLQILSHTMIVLCDEIVEWANRVAAGIEVSERTLALDVIDQVGPRGHFLQTPHTLEHFRRSIWQPRFFDRDSRAGWEAAGSKDLFARLNERVRRILETHQPQPLPERVQEAVAEILARREALKE